MKHIDNEKMQETFIKIFILIVFLIILLVFGFAIGSTIRNEANRISAGVIIDKDFESGYSIGNGNGNYFSYNSISNTYSFLIIGEKEGKEVRYWKEVTEKEYEQYEIGDYYPNN